MSYRCGGQRRTVEFGCGVVIRGHPTEVNKKSQRHCRICPECKGCYKPSEFNKTDGDANGWGGYRGIRKANEKVMNIFGDGNDLGRVKVKSGNLEEATRMLKEGEAEFINDPTKEVPIEKAIKVVELDDLNDVDAILKWLEK
jgi:hypothetical protein